MENEYSTEEITLWRNLDSQVGFSSEFFSGQQWLQSILCKNHRDFPSLLKIPAEISRMSWIYEHIRQFCIELGWLVMRMSKECTETACPKLTIVNQSYFCAAHATPKSCNAIEYSIHTLDSAIERLSNRSIFPKSAKGEISESADRDAFMKNVSTMARRLYRVFGHCYYSHKTLFKRFEASTALFERFLKVGQEFGFIPSLGARTDDATHKQDSHELAPRPHPSLQ